MACNTGISSSPTVDGTTLEFRVAALHNGLALMEDLQTRSYWDHVTGECIHGPMRGAQLPQVTPLRYYPAAKAVQRFPRARLALSRPSVRQRVLQRMVLRKMLGDEGHLPSVFTPSMTKDDERRPRMELGLGVWWPGISRFYPMDVLRGRDRALLDGLGGRRILVFVDPGSTAPVAVRLDAHEHHWNGDELVLDTGDVVRDLQRVDPQGAVHPLELVPQIFTRWYGFSATFPGCDVFER
ncbi:DUF3179 domain-containing (seleno)protein [Paraliomyxa miuraensis]|uniref:DUF3179 domain-containing (seleno)protein n=1 Tax=Paraliomyxa miuraensis TaxID=376150 RepID=UPI002251AD52|nr:DUF3179 domain-containing (seleno)protein [Paraliomyxa miuraensis]MCX4245147.1 DUF3179 domain-containing protein [Paraliomyxa miuraensis]